MWRRGVGESSCESLLHARRLVSAEHRSPSRAASQPSAIAAGLLLVLCRTVEAQGERRPFRPSCERARRSQKAGGHTCGSCSQCVATPCHCRGAMLLLTLMQQSLDILRVMAVSSWWRSSAEADQWRWCETTDGKNVFATAGERSQHFSYVRACSRACVCAPLSKILHPSSHSACARRV